MEKQKDVVVDLLGAQNQLLHAQFALVGVNRSRRASVLQVADAELAVLKAERDLAKTGLEGEGSGIGLERARIDVEKALREQSRFNEEQTIREQEANLRLEEARLAVQGAGISLRQADLRLAEAHRRLEGHTLDLKEANLALRIANLQAEAAADAHAQAAVRLREVQDSVLGIETTWQEKLRIYRENGSPGAVRAIDEHTAALQRQLDVATALNSRGSPGVTGDADSGFGGTAAGLEIERLLIFQNRWLQLIAENTGSTADAMREVGFPLLQHGGLVPGFQHGGLLPHAQRGMRMRAVAMVGEAGPELLAVGPSRRPEVIPHGRNVDSGGGDTYITVTESVSPMATARAIDNRLGAASRR